MTTLANKIENKADREDLTSFERGELPGFGRLYVPDPRDRKFLAVNTTEIPTLKELEKKEKDLARAYRTGPILNQGLTSKCVGYSTRQWLTTGTVVNKNPDPSPDVIYFEAQQRDPWPGADYDGTTVRAAMSYLKDRGYIDAYLWAKNAEEIARWMLAGLGPVVVGTDWKAGMMTPQYDKNAADVMPYVTAEPGDGDMGGHAYLIDAVDLKRKFPVGNKKYPSLSQRAGGFRITNSWGKNWGENGKAWIWFGHMDDLIKAHGEAAMAKEIKLS